MAVERKVAYVYSKEFIDECNKLPKVKNRASMVHSLIEAYGLLNLNNVSIVAPEVASAKDLAKFHSSDYVRCLQEADKLSSDDDCEGNEEFHEFGIGYDCPTFEDFYQCLTTVTGGTIKAAECLKNGGFSMAINWAGGWHHAHRDEASGFCYVNDIVLGILKLKEKFPRVLYIDLDLHHGDGVQEAFFYTSTVFTISFHKYSPGFYPGTGSSYEIGDGKGRHHCLNVPLLDGVDDKMFTTIVQNVVSDVVKVFKPDAIVCQCGVDGLAGDPMNSFNLTQNSFGACVYFLTRLDLPLLLLGGGGYNFADTARCWAFVTATALGRTLRKDIPEHEYFERYGPGYTLEISSRSSRQNKNSFLYLKDLISIVKASIESIYR